MKYFYLIIIFFFTLSAEIYAQSAHKNLRNGDMLYGFGKYAEAEKLFSAGLKSAEQSGLYKLEVATAQNNLAEVYRAQAKYSKAEPLYKNSLAIREKTLEPNHAAVAADLNNLASLLRKTNRKSEAAKLEARANAIPPAR